MLLTRDADKNAKDNAGKTPVDWAKEAHQSQLITLLVVSRWHCRPVPGFDPRRR